MKRLDLYISMNLKMTSEIMACIVLCLFTVMLFFWNTGVSMASMYILSGVSPFLAILTAAALRRICYTSIFGKSAGLYNSLPVDNKTMAAGKITAAGICCCMGILPVILMMYVVNTDSGKAMRLLQFMMNKGLLASETMAAAALVPLTAVVFMFALAAVILDMVLFLKGKKNAGNLLTIMITAAGCIVAVAVVCTPWVAAALADNINVTLMGIGIPVLSLIIAAAILAAAYKASLKLMCFVNGV